MKKKVEDFHRVSSVVIMLCRLEEKDDKATSQASSRRQKNTYAADVTHRSIKTSCDVFDLIKKSRAGRTKGDLML
jgi:hypothetical protein